MGFLTIAARRSVSVAERCAVADSEKLPCGGSSSITQADCEANNCCYDSSSSTSLCYYANDVTVQCTLDGQFVVVVSENVTLPSLDLGSIQLVDSSSPSCSPVTSLSSFVKYQFPVSACGSTVQELVVMILFQMAGGNVTYQNTMSAAITVRTGPEGSITRDSVYKIFFQCTYLGSQDVQVEAEVYTVAPPLPVVEQGPFDLELVIATDSSYGSYYVDADYPVTKTLRDPVAVEVHIMNRTDPNLVLTLGDCWVTPGPSASSQPQWSLLVNGCPYMGDNYLTSLVTVDSTSGVAYPSHYKRFVFEMFAFVDPVAQQALAEKIFIYCVAAACYPSATDPCTQSCPTRRSGRAADKMEPIASSRQNVLLHSGPVIIEADQVQTSSLEQEETTGRPVMVTNDLPGIVFRPMFSYTALTVFLSPWYGYVSEQYYMYVVTIALGRPYNWKTFTCPWPDPRLLSAERCTVAESQKLPCGGSSSITQADCVAKNCCYDSSSSTSPCYYANDVTVQCTLDGQFVVVVSENVTLPPLDLGSIKLEDSSSPSCSPVSSLSSFVMYQFPVSACGSTVQCTYSASQDVQVEAEVYTVAPPLPVVEQGPFDLELVIATDSSYGSYYVDADYPVTKTLRDPVAVEVHIMNRTDPNLVLTLGDCWVTPGPSASSQPQWSLLVNGCPNTGDNYLTSLVTVDSTSGVAYPSHYKRFVFEMFAFVDPVAQQALAEKIFIYCVAAACYPSAADPCTRSCPARRSGRAADKLAQIASSRKNVLLHSGPVVFEADQVTTSRLEQEARRSGSVPERCAVAESEKLPCGGSSSVTQADCEVDNCCYDLSSSTTSPCYYANDVTVQCTLDGQFVVVVSENVTLPRLDLGSIQLVDSSSSSCSPVTSLSSFVMYQFPVSACGSTVQVSGGNVTYQNTMSAAITVRTGPEGSITRDSVYKLFFQCTYSGSQDVQVEAEVYTVAPPLPVVEQGPFDLELVIATDSSYDSYYVDADYPVTKTLRDPVAVEVHIVNRTDPNLVLTLGNCWVTPGPSASSQPQWSLLVNGCPYTGDNYLTSLVTVDSTSGVTYPSHYKRFVFEMFAFVDPVAQQALAEKFSSLSTAPTRSQVSLGTAMDDCLFINGLSVLHVYSAAHQHNEILTGSVQDNI
ncbi:ZP4 protein, partial [Polypterus senegalus]